MVVRRAVNSEVAGSTSRISQKRRLKVRWDARWTVNPVLRLCGSIPSFGTKQCEIDRIAMCCPSKADNREHNPDLAPEFIAVACANPIEIACGFARYEVRRYGYIGL